MYAGKLLFMDNFCDHPYATMSLLMVCATCGVQQPKNFLEIFRMSLQCKRNEKLVTRISLYSQHGESAS